MKKIEKKIRIVFMGTPDFAVPSLNALHKGDYEVVLVVTQPDRPKGRGRKLSPPPVKKAATSLGYDIIQPLSIRTEEFADSILKLKPDIFVVVAFGHILPKNILALPKTGAINIHASLLPKYRGAAPIQWAIINGETETGVTTMFMDEGMDTGDILLSSKIKIASDETSSGLDDRLADFGVRCRVFRPPAGVTNPRLRAVLDAHGLRCVNWSVRARVCCCSICCCRGWTAMPSCVSCAAIPATRTCP